MYGVHAIGQHFFERGKVHGVAVAIEEEDMVGVDLANRLLNILVPDLKPSVFWVCRLVHRVVSSDLYRLSIHASEKNIGKHTQAFPA